MALVFFLAVLQGHAQLLVDDFSIEGGLSGTAPDVGGVWTTSVGDAGTIKVTNGKAVVPVTGWEMVTSNFPQQTSNTIYAGFTFNSSGNGQPLQPGPSLVGNVGIQFGDAYYFGGTSSDFILFLSDGISNNFSGGPSQMTYRWPVALHNSTDYRIVLGFTENGSQDQLTIWVNPTGPDSPSVPGVVGAISAGVSGFSLYESGYNGIYSADNVYVGSNFNAAANFVALPEPSVGLLLFCALAGLTRRPRQRVSSAGPSRYG